MTHSSNFWQLLLSLTLQREGKRRKQTADLQNNVFELKK